MNLFDLTGKTAIVTGGGRGIGRTIALAYAEAGANVAVVSRTEAELTEVCEEIESRFGRKAYYYPLDIRDKAAIDEMVEDVIEKEGKIDILVNGAGVNVRYKLVDFEEEDWDFVMDVNVKSIFLVSKAVIPHMQKQKRGKIINIASLTSHIGMVKMPAYVASKGGVAQLTKAIAVEYAEDGIYANAIGPGYIKTELNKVLFKDPERVNWMLSRIPMKRLGELDDMKGIAIFLASSASDYITGQTIYVDGGWLGS